MNPIHTGINTVIITFQKDPLHAKDVTEQPFTTPYVVCATVEDFPSWETAQRARISEKHLIRISQLAAQKGFVAHVLPTDATSILSIQR